MIIGDKYKVIFEPSDDIRSSKTFVCKDLIKNEAVFLKQLKVNAVGNDVALELFKRENRSLSILNHKNIIKYMDSGIDNGEPFIVTEHFQSDTLNVFLSNEKLSLEQKLDIAIQIIDGINYAHDQKVIHRDIKPQNILVNESMEVKLIDFGISKIMGALYNPTVTMKDYMTVRYSSPEQLQRLEAKIESDLYSYGLLLAYIFIEEEPPDDKTMLHKYIDRIEVLEIRDLVSKLVDSDLSTRIKSGYTVRNHLLPIKFKYVFETKKLYTKVTYSAAQKLYKIGMIDRPNNFIEIRNFIIKDTKQYSAYKDGNKYFFIGERVKYTCKVSQDVMNFSICDVNAIDNQILWEKETAKGEELFIPVQVINSEETPPKQNDFLYVIQILTDLEKEKDTFEREFSLESKLINSWNILLTEEFMLLDQKKNIGSYNDFSVDGTGSMLLVKVRSCDKEIDYNERIQLTFSNNEGQKTIGNFAGIIDENTISVSLDTDIDIDELCKQGILSIDTVQEKTNLKRYAYALNQVKRHNTYNPNIPQILNDASCVSINAIEPINHFFQPVFKNSNSANLMAVKKALSTKDIFLLQGPPGTGKTTVICEIICQILANDPDAKILLTSQSNVAVDHAIGKVSEILPDKRIIRIGRSNKISKNSEKLLYSNQLEEWVQLVKSNSTKNLFDFLEKEGVSADKGIVEQILNSGQVLENKEESDESDEILKIISIVGQWQKRLGKMDEFDEIFADKASIVAATCMGIASRNKLNDILYDWVIIDEAARATPLETLVPLVKGKKIIMVGDHKQLPPTIKTNLEKNYLKEKGLKKSDLEKSLFEELINNISHCAKMVLTEQFRMHPNISNMISEVFYPEVKITTILAENDRLHELDWGNKSIIWINTNEISNNKEANVAFSKKNEGEAHTILHIVENIANQYDLKYSSGRKVSVGIISGYSAHTKMLIDLINPSDTKKWKSIDIIIDNVDAFQGSEVDIVIYSIVRCNQNNEIGFLSDTRRLNVALSRGKNCLVIVGNLDFIKYANGAGGNPFTSVIKYIEKNKEKCMIRRHK